jgi:CHAT domain-containing protein
MGSDSYRAELVRLQKEEAALRKDLARYEGDAAKARAAAAAKRKSAMSTKSPSSIQSFLRTAEAEDKKAAVAAKKVADFHSKIAVIAERQRSKQRSLDTAQKSEQTLRDRADEVRRRREKEHARDIARLSRPTVHHVIIREPEPERLRVLYMTASPVGAPEHALRVDAEMNNVLRAIRASKHSDLIDLSPRPAAAPQELVDGINDLRPHVVHFSGHAGARGLLFDNASVTDPGDHMVSYGQIARLLRATDNPPMLVVLKACDTASGASELLEAVPLVVAMKAPVGDASAAVFATHFYAAIGGAQTVAAAVDQATVMTEIALQIDMDLVTLCAREGVDPGATKLVMELGS